MYIIAGLPYLVAVCCSVLQCVAVCCKENYMYVSSITGKLYIVAVCCSVSQHCSQCVSLCAMQCLASRLEYVCALSQAGRNDVDAVQRVARH